MRAPPLPRLRLVSWLAPRRVLAAVVEVVLLGWAVLLLETLGARVAGGAADVFGFVAGTAMVLCLAVAARAGHLPGTVRVLAALKALGLRLARRLDPPSGVAFRLPVDPPPRRDRGRVVPGLVLAALLALALLAGPRLLPALGWVRDHLAFTPHLLALFALWALYGTVTVAALLAARLALRGRGPRVAGSLPLVGLTLGVVVLGLVPGWVPIALLLGLALVPLPALLRRPVGRYYLYRRDAGGRLVAVAVDAYLRSAYVLVSLLLLFVTALGQAHRLGEASFPHGPFTLTEALALSASAGGLLLVVRIGVHLRRLLGSPRTWPEMPLVPTLWWPGGDVHAPWAREARARGWAVDARTRPPAAGHDLVAEREGDPARFTLPDADLPPDEACFRLERRFHVVKRRLFRRRLEAMWKAIYGPRHPAGCGTLFCPHAWPIPGVIRDTGGAAPEEGATRSTVGGALVGPPFAAVFPPRLRRYLSAVFGALDLDVLYWEDGIRFADLRRVLGVLFETYDQGRFPAQDRHFIGLPGLRVLIQEADEAEEAFLEAPAWEADAAPPPLRARALVIRRDDGGREVETPDRAPATRRPEPMLV